MKKSECAIDKNGNKRWFLNGKLHREDGPAVEYTNGSKEWWIDDGLHREDGPAVEYFYGEKYWYLNDKYYTEEAYYKKLYELGKISYNDYILEMI